MNQETVKKLLYLLCIIALAIVLTLAEYEKSEKPSFHSKMQLKINGDETVELWEDEENNAIYAFLPSYTNLSLTTILIPDNEDVCINDYKIQSGMDCSLFETGHKYDLTINGAVHMTFELLKSSNIATMYIDTSSGSMEMVHKSKANKEDINISLYSSDGIVNYSGGKNSQIRGRGNATWEYGEKKPYNIYFDDEISLLDMKKSSKWILLSNEFDDTQLRNKLILDYARDVQAPEMQVFTIV